MCPTLDPIVVNPPKDKETYTYSEKDIVNIVKSAVSRGEIPTGGGSGEDTNPNDNVTVFIVHYRSASDNLETTKYAARGLTYGTAQDVFDTIKSNVESLAEQLSLTIDPITNLVSLNVGLNKVVTALITAGQTTTVYGLLAALSNFQYCGTITVWDSGDIVSVATIGGYDIANNLPIPWLIGVEEGALVKTDFATVLAAANVNGVYVNIPGLED